MKLVGVIGTAVLSLTLGAAAPAYAQQEQHDQQEEQKDKPEQNAKKTQPDKPATSEEKSTQQQDNNAKPGEKSAQQQQHPTQEAKPGPQAQGARGNGSGRISDNPRSLGRTSATDPKHRLGKLRAEMANYD